MLKILLLFLGISIFSNAFSQFDQNEINDYLQKYLNESIAKQDKFINEWKAQYADTSEEARKVRELISVKPPLFLMTNANIVSYLFEQTNDTKYAELTKENLFAFIHHKKWIPKKFVRNQAEELVSVSWFRQLPEFILCYQRTKGSGIYAKSEIEIIQKVVAKSANSIFNFPEWGAHNRAMLRAESLISAAVAFPDHPDALKWLQMAEILASDTIEKWEIEDAQIYHAVWLRAYINYLDISGQTEVFQSPILKFYFDYLVRLMAPNRTIPEFGDGRWAEMISEYYLILERGAKEYQSGEMKWAANELFAKLQEQIKTDFKHDEKKYAFYAPNTDFPILLIERAKYMDPTVKPIQPKFLSGDCIDEIYSKKIVFRSDWGADATYLLLNYRDEGYYSIMQKNYLKYSLAVEEEKMHHGHSDENSICMLMKNGVLLLSDGGYRQFAPSGEHGAFRADYFHNRVVVRNVKKSINQPYFEIIQNSGAYNAEVRTTKLDFQSFPEIEYSRTRLEDLKQNYRWDRIIAHHKKDDYFIMVDAIKFSNSDYFTVANLLHTQKIIAQGKNWFVTRIERIENKYKYEGNIDLLIIFLQKKYTGTEKENRNYQDELALFQGTSQFYDAGKVESFVTILYLLEKGSDPQKLVNRFKLCRDDQIGIGIQVKNGSGTDLYGFKLDLDMDLLKQEIRPRYNYNSGKIAYGDVETDADMCFVNLKTNNSNFSATNLVKLVYKDQVLFDVPESQFFQTWGKSDRMGRAKWRAWSNYVD